MRHSATRAILERDDVIIVASVSCIYGIGSVETYSGTAVGINRGDRIDRNAAIQNLVALQYRRNDDNFSRGAFRVRGDVIDIFPAHYEDRAWRVELFGDTVDNITEFDPLTGHKAGALDAIKVYANSHYVTPRPTLQQAMKGIKAELITTLADFRTKGKLLEAQRLEQRTHLRPGDDRGHRKLRRHRELFPLADGPQTRRAAADPVRISARQCPGLRRRKPCDGAADRRHVQRRLSPQIHPGRIWLPPASRASTTGR